MHVPRLVHLGSVPRPPNDVTQQVKRPLQALSLRPGHLWKPHCVALVALGADLQQKRDHEKVVVGQAGPAVVQLWVLVPRGEKRREPIHALTHLLLFRLHAVVWQSGMAKQDRAYRQPLLDAVLWPQPGLYNNCSNFRFSKQTANSKRSAIDSTPIVSLEQLSHARRRYRRLAVAPLRQTLPKVVDTSIHHRLSATIATDCCQFRPSSCNVSTAATSELATVAVSSERVTSAAMRTCHTRSLRRQDCTGRHRCCRNWVIFFLDVVPLWRP